MNVDCLVAAASLRSPRKRAPFYSPRRKAWVGAHKNEPALAGGINSRLPNAARPRSCWCKLLTPLVLLLSCAAFAQTDRTIVIARAATLTLPFDALAKALPEWRCQQESGGSRFLIRKLVDLSPRFDILAVADAGLLPPAIQQSNGKLANWWIVFARNELVLAYTPRSQYADEINSRNWFTVLLRPGVNSGYANPDLDPEGYNTLIAWKLAERYYHCPGLFDQLRAAVPRRNIRDHSVALLALLEAGELDYCWQYRSVALQHDLKFVELPTEINLGDPARAHEYASATVAVAGVTPGTTTTLHGEPIEYAITIPANVSNRAGAIAFITKLLSPAGVEVLRANQQLPVTPAIPGGASDQIPAELRRLLK